MTDYSNALINKLLSINGSSSRSDSGRSGAAMAAAEVAAAAAVAAECSSSTESLQSIPPELAVIRRGAHACSMHPLTMNEQGGRSLRLAPPSHVTAGSLDGMLDDMFTNIGERFFLIVPCTIE